MGSIYIENGDDMEWVYDTYIAPKGLTYHHTASARGYVTRKRYGEMMEYKGKFGDGFVVYRPRYDTSQYVYIDYYTKPIVKA